MNKRLKHIESMLQHFAEGQSALQAAQLKTDLQISELRAAQMQTDAQLAKTDAQFAKTDSIRQN